MGTEFLARIGEVASAALTRLLPKCAARWMPRPRRARDADIARHLEYLKVERRLAERTLALYGEAFVACSDSRRAPAAARGEDAPRRAAARRSCTARAGAALDRARCCRRGGASIAGSAATAWSPPTRSMACARRAPRSRCRRRCRSTMPSPWSRIATSEGDGLAARDACIAELLYGCGLRVGELVGLDVVASGSAAGWIDAGDASAHVLGKGRKRRAVPVGAPALAALAGGSRCAATSRAPTRRRSLSAAAARDSRRARCDRA